MGNISEDRLKVVKNAFQFLDSEGSGNLDFEYIKSQYMPHNHPDVLSGKKGEEEVFEEFLSTFATHRYLMYGTDHSRPVNLNEWVQYYRHISANCGDSDYFKKMLNNVWNLDGKGFKYKTGKVSLNLLKHLELSIQTLNTSKVFSCQE